MTVNIRTFAVLREAFAAESMTVTLASGALLSDLQIRLEDLHGSVADILRSSRYFLHEMQVDAGEKLAEGDEVIILPPVSGG